MFAARRDNVRELFGGKPLAAAAQGATPEKLRQQEYAAQLREQIATREAARQKEKAHSLRQSAALLELRQAAPVLPGAGAGAPYRSDSLRDLHPTQLGQGRDLAALAWHRQASPTSQQQEQQDGSEVVIGHQHRQAWAAWQPADTGMLPMPPLQGHPSATGNPASSWQHEHAANHSWAEQHTAVPPAAPPPGAQHAMPGARPPPPSGVDHSLAGAQSFSSESGLRNGAVMAIPLGMDVQPSRDLPSNAGSLHHMPSGASDGPLTRMPHASGRRATPHGHGRGPAPALEAGLLGPSPGRLAAALAGFGPDGQVAAREVAERKRAQYKAELERQVQEKAEQRRQEQAAEQAAVVRKAAEAEQLRLRAASGTYGGGSGPLRDTAGRPITDLNQVRHWQVAALLPKPEVQPVPGHQTPHLAARPAHWATAPAAAADAGWHDGPPAGATLPPLQRQPSRLGSWQHAGSSAGVQTQPPPAQQLQRQLVEGHGGLLDPPRLQGGVPSGPRGSLQQPQSGLLQGQGLPAAQLAAQIGPTSWNGSPAAPQPEQSANLDSGAADPAMPSPSGQPSDAPSLQSMGVNDGAPLMRLRSDRSFQTPSEAERRAKAQAEFQAALRAQMEEKARQKADERRRQREEEAAEEARLERERERMRAQFDADQAKQKAKHAGKQAGGAETLESGGISIKFKPPPAGRPGPQQAQQQHATKPAAPAEATAASGGQGAVHHDDAVPGVESRVKGPPPRRQSSLDGAASSSSQQQEQGAPMQRQPQPSGDCLEACTAAGVAPVGADCQPTLARGPTMSHLHSHQQELQGVHSAAPPGSAAFGASSMQQPAWQQLMPGMTPAGQPHLPFGPAAAPAALPWQQAAPWGVPAPPMAPPVPPAAAPDWAYPAPFQHHLHQLPTLASMPVPPYPVQQLALPPWGPLPPQLPGPLWAGGPGPPPLLHPPMQQHQQLDGLPQGHGSSEPAPHQPWWAGHAPVAALPLPTGPALQQQQEQQQPGQQHLLGPAWAGSTAALLPASAGMPVWETRSVLSIRDSIQDSRPPTARVAAAQLPGSQVAYVSNPAYRPPWLARNSLAEPNFAGKSGAVLPPQHPVPAEPARQVVVPTAPELPSLGKDTAGGMQPQLSQARGREHGLPGPLASAQAPLAAGLSTWAQLKDVPVSRRTSGTLPPVLPPPQLRKVSARRRSSWAGLFRLVGGTAEVPSAGGIRPR